MGGNGRFEEVTLKESQKQKTQKDDKPMTDDDMKKVAKMVQDGVTAGIKAHADAQTKTVEKSDKEQEAEAIAKKEACLKSMGIKKPIFKGKLSDDNALRKHQRDLEIFEAGMELDLSKAEDVGTFREAVSEINKSYEDLEEEDNSGQSKAPTGFVQTTKTQSNTKNEEDDSILSKEEAENAQAVADFINGKK